MTDTGTGVAVDDLFSGTAEYYARYRPQYPPELLTTVLAEGAPGTPSRLLDLGCGTGELAIPLSAAVDEVHAVDASAEMVHFGRAKAEQAGRQNICWLVRTAEDFNSLDEHFNLITVGAAFHWMDRHVVGGRALRWLRPGGAIAVAGVNSLWNGTEEWHRVALEVIQRWLGERRRAGPGAFDVRPERHEDVLRTVGFTGIVDTAFPVRHTWSVEEYLGYLYSTSFASRAVLGDRVAGFEADLRQALHAHDPSGAYHETLRFHCVVGRRPPS